MKSLKKHSRFLCKLLLLGAVFLLMGTLTACGETNEITPTPAPEDITPTEDETPGTTTADVTPDSLEENKDNQATPTEVPPEPFEKDAASVVADIVIGWNLGNTLDAHVGAISGLSTETSWGNPKATKELMDLVKQAGFNAVRVPVTWGNHMDKEHTIDQKWLARVAEVIGYVLDNDMYCIINAHHDTGVDGWLRAGRTNEEEMRAKYTALWTQVATYFADYPDKLLFESFNELLSEENHWNAPPFESLKVTNELNQLFVDTVRSSGGNNDKRCLIVNTYAGSTESNVLGNFKLPTDTVENRLIAEAHAYSPFQFTHEDYPSVTTYTENEVKSAISPLFVKLGIQKIPIIIGEFGCVDKKNDKERVAWTKYYVETANKYGIKCFWWDNGILTQYAIIDRRGLEISEPDIVDAMMNAANTPTTP